MQKPLEIAVVGEGMGCHPRSAAVHEHFLPNKVVCGWPSRTGRDAPSEEVERLVPLLTGKCTSSLPAAFVCEDMVCSPPIGPPQALADRLGKAARGDQVPAGGGGTGTEFRSR